MNATRFGVQDGSSPFAGSILRLMQQGRPTTVAEMRTLSPLSDKAQVEIDKIPVEVGLERLALVAALLMKGLRYPLTDPLSIGQLEWDQVSKVGGARRTMLPTSRGENALTDRIHKRLPIYCTLCDFNMNVRLLKMSERVGQPLDTSMVAQEVRRANESIEDATIYGATTLDGQGLIDSTYSVPGLLTPPGTANVITNSVDWTAANVIGATGPAMAADVLAMVAKANAANKFGPFALVIGTSAGAVIQGQFTLYQTGTIQSMLESMSFGNAKLQIIIADRMPNTVGGPTQQIALVQLTNDVIEIVDGQPPTVVPYVSNDNWMLYWTILAIQIPRVRSDYNGQCGIVIGSK